MTIFKLAARLRTSGASRNRDLEFFFPFRPFSQFFLLLSFFLVFARAHRMVCSPMVYFLTNF